MTKDPFITFKEAADLLGDVSKKTIERFYKREKDNPEYAGAFEHRPDAKGAKFFIRKSVALQTEFKQGSPGKASTTDSSDIVQEALRELANQLHIKDEQLAEKDKQLEYMQKNLTNEQILRLKTLEKSHPFFNSFLMLTGRKKREEGMPYTDSPSAASVSHAPASGRKIRTGFLITFAVASAVLAILIIAKIILSYFF